MFEQFKSKALSAMAQGPKPDNLPAKAMTFSEAAAEYDKYVVSLERRLSQLEAAYREACTRNDLVEEANNILHEQIAQMKLEHEQAVGILKVDRDYYYQQFCNMRTKLQVSEGIIKDALEEAEHAKLGAQGVIEKPLKEYDPAQVEKEIEDLFMNHKEKRDDAGRV